MTAKQHLDLWRKGQQPLLSVVYSWMLGSVAEKCEIAPGEEFRVALEEAVKVQILYSMTSSAHVCIQDVDSYYSGCSYSSE